MRIRNFGLIAALALGSLLVCTNVSNAQDAKEGKKRGFSPQARVEQMDKELKLTADQKTKLTALFEDQRTKMQNVPADERRQKMRDMREESDKKIKAILTPDQWEKYQKAREEMKKGGKKKKSE